MTRRMLALYSVLAVAGIVALLPLITLVGGLLVVRPVIDEVTRVPSPDGVLDAVIRRINYDALSPFEYRVYIVGTGKSPSKRDKALFIAERVESLELNWPDSHILQIRFKRARIISFANLLLSPEYHNVEVQLVQLEPYALDEQDRWGGGYRVPKNK